jgi:outer membrane protein assembly factor BamA
MAAVDNAKAQATHQLIIHPVDIDSLIIPGNLNLKTTFQTREDCRVYIQRLPLLLQSAGYISASVDSVEDIVNQTTVYLFVGEQFNSLSLKVRDQDNAILQQLGWNEKNAKNKTIQFTDYTQLSQQLLDYFESSGYPFAKINLDSISLENKQITALLNIDRGFPYHLDSVRMYGSAKISRNFIYHYLNIQPRSLYSKKKLEKINQRLLELPYLEQVQPWDLSMLNTGSLLNLYLQPKKSNQINVLAGFLPSNQQTGGKLLLTVDANLQMQNAFGSGESLGLVWQQIQPKSPRLHLQYTQPYMFNSSFGVDFLFDLYKKDSAFLNLNGQLGFYI